MEPSRYMARDSHHIVAIFLDLFVNAQLKQGKIEAGKSYVPQGLTAAQYQKFREQEAKKKADNYSRNVKKAGIFTDYTEWYKKRGTDLSDAWAKNKNTLGHNMAKTKYDWSGNGDRRQYRGKK